MCIHRCSYAHKLVKQHSLGFQSCTEYMNGMKDENNQMFVFCNMKLRLWHNEELDEDVADVPHLLPPCIYSTAI